MKGFNERQNCRKYSEKIITFPMKNFSKNAKHSSIISLKQQNEEQFLYELSHQPDDY